MQTKRNYYVIPLILVLLLVGCHDNHVPSSSYASFETELDTTNSVPTENIMAVDATSRLSVFPSRNAGVYIPHNILYYFDFETGQKIAFCSQPGCTHGDKSCSAYLGNAHGFAEYKNDWYIIAEEKTGDFSLIRINPSTSAREIIYQWQKDDHDAIFYNSCRFSYGQAYISLYYQHTGLEDKASRTCLYQVDLGTGVCNTILECIEAEGFFVLGASETQVAVDYRYLASAPMSQDLFFSAYGSTAKYEEYIAEYYKKNTVVELRLYNTATNTFYTLADNKNDGYHPSTDPALCYQDKLIYQLNNTLYIYNLTSETSHKLLDQDSIMVYWLMDGKAFYIAGTVSDCRIYYADLISGTSINLKNQGVTEHMVFSISGETANMFIGLYPDQAGNGGGYSWISKEDFYADDYSSAQLIK